MQKGDTFMRKNRFVWILVVCFLFLSGCSDKNEETLLFSEGTAVTDATDGDGADADSDAGADGDASSDAGGIYVYICGSVKNPGVYEVAEGSRIYQVVDLAGGFTKKADTESVNLAETVTDGQMVNIPSESETAETSADSSTVSDSTTASAESGTDSSGTSDASDSGLININTADLTSLMTLSGIGEVKAQAIIDYREENGAFASTEDIMNVSGIADATYANIKDYITV